MITSQHSLSLPGQTNKRKPTFLIKKDNLVAEARRGSAEGGKLLVAASLAPRPQLCILYHNNPNVNLPWQLTVILLRNQRLIFYSCWNLTLLVNICPSSRLACSRGAQPPPPPKELYSYYFEHHSHHPLTSAPVSIVFTGSCSNQTAFDLHGEHFIDLYK